jgi:photosystem I P700 chlorophyll a apoprotein A2
VPLHSGVYHWWYTIGLELTKNYMQVQLVYYYYHLFYYLLVTFTAKFRQVYLGFKNNESRLNHHLSGLLGLVH